MMVGVLGWIGLRLVGYAAEASGGLGRGGVIAIVVVSVIAVAAFVWIFRETGRRD